MLAIFITLVALLTLIFFAKGYFLREKKQNFSIPDPSSHQVRLAGQDYDFEIADSWLKVADISLDLKTSYIDPSSPATLRFSGGASVEFIPRAKSNA